MEKEIDFSVVYDFNEYPDKNSGRCDNCDKAHFHSSISGGKLIRECSNCGMKKEHLTSSLTSAYKNIIRVI